MTLDAPGSQSNSPLRYPGGKAALSDFLAATIEANTVKDCVYVEPYAGGAGAAINLLLSRSVERIALNDADVSIWAFWYALLNHTDELVRRVDSTTVTVAEWKRQREIYLRRPRSTVDLGFAVFFLNRCNRSGIITNGGVIGGLDQSGAWKIDARYNRATLIDRIKSVAAFRRRIELCNMDAISFLRSKILPQRHRSRFFIYLDPPYYTNGARLYLNYYGAADHAKLARFLRRIKKVDWLITYDNVPEIRRLYAWRPIRHFQLHYSAAASRQGSEIVVASEGLRLPASELKALAA